jgi:hypothetical protein
VEGSAGVGAAMKGFEDMEDVEIFESVLSVLDWRDLRRKGMDGRRKVGKTEGTAWGSEGLRRKDIMFAANALARSTQRECQSPVRAHSSDAAQSSSHWH